MLSRVLLHIDEPPRPVDGTAYIVTGPEIRPLAGEVKYPLVILYYPLDSDALDFTGIRGLTAGFGVEAGSIQFNSVHTGARLDRNNARLKLGAEAVLLVETLRQSLLVLPRFRPLLAFGFRGAQLIRPRQ
jgi:hypothetical protein